MSNRYNIDGIIQNLEKERNEAIACRNAWQAVTFPTKKNGEPFAVMSKNFNKASYRKQEWSSSGEDYELVVYCGDVPGSGYISDTIWCTARVEDVSPEQAAKTENYLPKNPYLKQKYQFDLEDIKQAIMQRVDCLNRCIQDLTICIDNTPAAYRNFNEAYINAREELFNAVGDGSAYYDIIDTVTTYARYR